MRALLKSARDDWEVVQSLFKSQHYGYALFFCHLALEKALKALVIKRTHEHAPHMHDLRRLAEQALLTLTDNQRKDLDVISTFNIRARYDDFRRTFYQKANRVYATRYIKIAEEFYQWLRKELRSRK